MFSSLTTSLAKRTFLGLAHLPSYPHVQLCVTALDSARFVTSAIMSQWTRVGRMEEDDEREEDGRGRFEEENDGGESGRGSRSVGMAVRVR